MGPDVSTAGILNIDISKEAGEYYAKGNGAQKVSNGQQVEQFQHDESVIDKNR